MYLFFILRILSLNSKSSRFYGFEFRVFGAVNVVIMASRHYLDLLPALAADSDMGSVRRFLPTFGDGTCSEALSCQNI